MQLPHLEDSDGPAISLGTDSRVRAELEGDFDECDRAPEIDSGDRVAYVSRGNARYHKGGPECEADYLAAFSLDAHLTAFEIVRRLTVDIRDDVACVLMDCRNRLGIEPQDVIARTRLGLTLLMFQREDEALCELQHVFRQRRTWRPFLRLLVNEAKEQRLTLFARVLRGL